MVPSGPSKMPPKTTHVLSPQRESPPCVQSVPDKVTRDTFSDRTGATWTPAAVLEYWSINTGASPAVRGVTPFPTRTARRSVGRKKSLATAAAEALGVTPALTDG
jgi:hypothetical protein